MRPKRLYLLIYCKQDFSTLELNKLSRSIEATLLYKNPDNDPRGVWQSDNFSVGPAIKEKLYEITTPFGRKVTPPSGRCWLLTKSRYEEFLEDNRIWFGKDGKGVPRIKRFLSEVRDGVVAMSLWTHTEVGHTQDAKRELKEVLHENQSPFETVKPLKLIDRIFKLTTDNTKPYTILDFFAGSGTTLHATMALNAEDGGNRQCILVTNNENNICEEVTYERNKRVIEGYTNAKGVAVEGLKNNNLRYYKSDYVSRTKSLKNKKELTRLATELLCIKEDCYVLSPTLSKGEGAKAEIAVFEDIKTQMVVIYDDVFIEDSIEIIMQLKENKQNNNPIKVYVFSNGQYPYTEDFDEVAAFVELCALPDAIYKAYQNVLPKTKREVVPTLEDDEATDENLFNQA